MWLVLKRNNKRQFLSYLVFTVILENFGQTNASDSSVSGKFRHSRFLYVCTVTRVHVQYTALKFSAFMIGAENSRKLTGPGNFQVYSNSICHTLPLDQTEALLVIIVMILLRHVHILTASPSLNGLSIIIHSRIYSQPLTVNFGYDDTSSGEKSQSLSSIFC